MKVLLIYHQPNLLLSLYRTLRRDYEIECAASIASAQQKLHNQSFDLIVLDLDGAPTTTDCGQLRTYTANTPIIVLVSNPSLATKLATLDSGANDLLAKPISPPELMARMRVALRGNTPDTHTHHRLVVGDLVLDTAKHLAHRAGIPIILRPKEFTLLECLMRNAGNIVDSVVLASQAWEVEQEIVVSNLHVHINHLRKKIDKPFAYALIRTIHGMGYMLDLPQNNEPSSAPAPTTSSKQISIL